MTMKIICKTKGKIVLCNLLAMLICFIFAGCDNNNYDTDVNVMPDTTKQIKIENEKLPNNEIKEKEDIKDSVSVMCEVDSCRNNGLYSIEGFGGVEHYCYSHYKEIQDMADSLRVACEVDGCNKDGLYSVDGFAGVEYYCYSHYNEIQDMVNALLE